MRVDEADVQIAPAGIKQNGFTLLPKYNSLGVWEVSSGFEFGQS